MSTIGEVRAGLAATLTGAGLRATVDPRDINPPCVLVGLGQGVRITGCAFEGTVDVTVIAPGAGHADAAAWLDATTTTVAALLVAATWSPDSYPVAGQPSPLLAYTLTVPAAWEAA